MKARLFHKWSILGTIFLLQVVSAQAAPPDGYEYDRENGEDIMYLCAGCHGEYGQGGGDGEYPRLAGLPAKYLANQMRAYSNRERLSIAMIPYAEEFDRAEDDLLDISTYLSELELMTRMPPVPEDMDSYEKLLLASQVFNVVRVEGDVEAGEQVYLQNCRKCHGKEGLGWANNPPLAGQYSVYLRLQIEMYLSGERINKRMLPYLENLGPVDIDNLLAYLSTVDDAEGVE